MDKEKYYKIVSEDVPREIVDKLEALAFFKDLNPIQVANLQYYANGDVWLLVEPFGQDHAKFWHSILTNELRNKATEFGSYKSHGVSCPEFHNKDDLFRYVEFLVRWYVENVVKGGENMQFEESLAGTGKPYLVLQGRIKDGKLHIQCDTIEINRDYGFAVDVEVPDEFAEWLNEQNHTEPSLYPGSPAKYVKMQARVYGDHTVHIQIKGTPLNRSYGAAIDIENPKFAQMVRAIFEVAKAKELI